MSRHRPSAAYGHSISKLMADCYRLSWTWDRYYEGRRGRYPQGMSRDTDFDGAVRFAKKWKVTRMPDDIKEAVGK